MKKTALLALFLLSVYTIFACTFIPDSFCSSSHNMDDVVLTGEVIAVDTTGIDLKVIEVFKGMESRAIIRIWDGTDFDCNGPFSMAASDLGSIGDTLVLILPKITAQENSWDIIGDYRRPNYTNYTTSLQVERDTVIGFILGDLAAPQGNLWKLPYETFKNAWLEEGTCLDFSLSAEEVNKQTNIRYTNPVYSNLLVVLGEPGVRGQMSIYSLNGILLKEQEIQGKQEVEFDLSGLQKGVYILNFTAPGTLVQSLKIVKM